MNLTQARTALADALSTVDTLDVRPKAIRQPKADDGWVMVARVAPSDYTRCMATLLAVVVLGADELLAHDRVDALAVALVDAVADLDAADVSLEPDVFDASGGPLYVLTLTLTLEVEPS